MAEGGEKREVKMNGEKRFDFYENGIFIGGFELNKKNLPEIYFTDSSSGSAKSVSIISWGEYKEMRYPLEIHNRNSMAVYKTDYWDPRETDAEKAFNISFNPNIMLEKLK
jgi:hypothetical protein